MTSSRPALAPPATSPDEKRPSKLVRQLKFAQQILSRSFRYLPATLKAVWKPYLLWALLFEVMLQGFNFLLHFLEGLPVDGANEHLILLIKINQILIGFLWAGITIFLIPHAYLKSVRSIDFKLAPFVTRQVWPLTIESLRSTAAILLWSLALIIPGIIQVVRLQFVPFVVLFLKSYDKGEVDALEASRSLARGFTWGLIFLSLVLMPPLTITQMWHSSYQLTTDPALSLISWVLAMLLDLIYNIALIVAFETLLVSKAKSVKLESPSYNIANLDKEFPLSAQVISEIQLGGKWN